MSAGMTVEDFKYVRGVNDAEYIELLKNAYEGQKYITSKAIAKLKEQPEIIHCGECRFREIRGNNGYCDHITGEEIMVWKDEYCSWAEKRTDEQV